MPGFLIAIIAICVIGYLVWSKVGERKKCEERAQADREQEKRTSELIETLADRIYAEIKSYGEKNGMTLDDITRLNVSQHSSFVVWRGLDVKSQRIEYEALGYKIDDDKEPYGEKTLKLQKAVVSRIGDNWVVVSERKLESYTRDSQVVVKSRDDGSIEMSHPKEFFYRIESEVISRDDYEQRLKKKSQRPTSI